MDTGKGILAALVLVLVLLILLGGGFVWFQMQGKELKEPLPVEVDMGEFTTNLADTERTRYIQTQVTLLVQGMGIQKKVAQEKAALRDAINSTLRSFTSARLQTPHGEDELKAALKAAVEGILGPGTVQKVYLPRLVIQ
ncbi:MAG: flagellar basal body-associated FliL family protein [Clostridiales bacterium]|nr:flagellar basal body-associated FliL family protein [Clostridiales bacterium]